MLWAIFALAAPALWAASNNFDAELVRSRQVSGASLLVTGGIASALPGIALLATGTSVGVHPGVIVLGVLTGAVGLCSCYPYFRALEHAQAVAVILMWNASPVLVAVLARVFLNELLSASELGALALLLLSAVIGGACLAGGSNEKLRASPALWMALASVLTAVEAVLQKTVFGYASIPHALLLISMGSTLMACIVLLISPRARGDLRGLLGARTARLVVGSETLNQLASTATGIAVGLGPVSLVKAISGTQPVFVALMRGEAGNLLRVQGPTRSLQQRVSMFVAVGLAVAGLAMLGGG